MSNIAYIASETIFFSLLVSLFVQGLGAASLQGGILYPFRLWMEGLFRSRKLEDRYRTIALWKEHRTRTKYYRGAWIEPALLKIELMMSYRAMWHKPILTCMMCMSSVWGTVIFWCLPIEHNLYVWLLGVPISSALTVWTQKLRG